ncbi:hypothetical protein NDU88_001994 [Pleurodeles waltl]|uniref:Uncharacterized protein n=1 Tax=Pleurodeles waltl TaxID=8319 RepID=A0AAV7P5K7_PLEWA|nr:hypothetical protein NDU88_001994 [Pleurodeles waltl]
MASDGALPALTDKVHAGIHGYKFKHLYVGFVGSLRLARLTGQELFRGTETLRDPIVIPCSCVNDAAGGAGRSGVAAKGFMVSEFRGGRGNQEIERVIESAGARLNSRAPCPEPYQRCAHIREQSPLRIKT